MIVELIEESKFGKDPMYAVKVDGSTIQWFSYKKDAEAFYDSVIADPNFLEPKRNILKSEEINVSLDKQNS